MATPITAAFHGKSTELHMPSSKSGTLDGTSLVAEVDDIGGLDLSRAMVDLLAYGDDDVRRLPGAKDGGSFSLTVNFVPDDTDHAALVTAYTAGTLQPIAIKWVSGSNFARVDFEGYISNLSTGQPKDDKVTATVEVTIHGAVVFDLTGS